MPGARCSASHHEIAPALDRRRRISATTSCGPSSAAAAAAWPTVETPAVAWPCIIDHRPDQRAGRRRSRCASRSSRRSWTRRRRSACGRAGRARPAPMVACAIAVEDAGARTCRRDMIQTCGCRSQHVGERAQFVAPCRRRRSGCSGKFRISHLVRGVIAASRSSGRSLKPLFCGQVTEHRHAAEQLRHQRVGDPVRRRDDDLVALVDASPSAR